MKSKTRIEYRADSLSAHGWEQRRLMPRGGITSLLWETIDYSGRLPALGERVREYRQDEVTGHVTHAKDGDWIVTDIQHFSSPHTSDRIIVCYCQYQPSGANWETVKRGLPVSELMQQEAANN